VTNWPSADILSELELLRPMFDVGYFPPNTPPDKWISFNGTSPS
jgi:hypothetical protein